MRLHLCRLPHAGLSAGLTLATCLVLFAGLSTAACGGAQDGVEAQDDDGRTEAPVTASAAPATTSPRPVSSLPPLVSIGETVRFMTPEGAVVRVTASDYEDPGAAPDGVSADAGERLVTLELTVTAEGAAGTPAVPAPFATADSFILIAADDTIAAAKLGDDSLLGAGLSPGEAVSTTLAFSVGAATQSRFVCTPLDGSRPRSATWEID